MKYSGCVLLVPRLSTDLTRWCEEDYAADTQPSLVGHLLFTGGRGFTDPNSPSATLLNTPLMEQCMIRKSLVQGARLSVTSLSGIEGDTTNGR